jgi:large subunit ribosomal protein L23
MNKSHGVTHKYDVIQAPVVTEKSTMVIEGNYYVFNVSSNVSKFDIKNAVEQLFNVKVQQVRTLIRAGKVKRFKGTIGQRSDQKRAYVKLVAGHKIDVMAGA